VKVPLQSTSQPEPTWHTSSRKSPGIGFPSSSSHVRIPHEPSVTGADLLCDIFTGRRHTGVKVSPFFSDDAQLRSVLVLHGLDCSDDLISVRNLRIKLLNHLVGGDCFLSQCATSDTHSPDRTACRCIAVGHSSQLAITETIIGILRNSDHSAVSTDHLLSVLESTGCQGQYENRAHRRRRVIKSLDLFTEICREKATRTGIAIFLDPFGDLFRGFEHMQKGALSSIMDRHSILLGHRRGLSRNDMLAAIVSHIADGECMKSSREPHNFLFTNAQTVAPTFVNSISSDSTPVPSCGDFVRYVGMNQDGYDIATRIKVLTLMRDRCARKPLLLLLKKLDIDHDPSESIRHLRSALSRMIKRLQKSNAGVVRPIHAAQQHREATAEWPSVVPQELKDEFITNFRKETSSDRLRTFTCASCAEDEFLFNKNILPNDDARLSCLRMSPNISLQVAPSTVEIEYWNKGIVLDT